MGVQLSRVSLGVGCLAALLAGLRILMVVRAEVGLGNEAPRLPRVGNLLVHLVDILEGESLGLVDHGPDEGDADEAAAAPHEEYLGLQVGVARAVVDHVGGCVTDGEVEEPVGGRGHGQTFGTDLERVDLTGDNWFRLVKERDGREGFSEKLTPCDGAPRGGEEENVDADEGDENLVGSVGENSDTDNGHDELTHTHADGAEEKEITTAHLLDHVDTGQGGDDIDQVGGKTDEERVVNARVLEELSTIVEDEVDTGQLLECLKTTSCQEPLDHVGGEAVGIGRLAERHLVLVDGLDLVKLGNDGRVIWWQRPKTAHGLCGTLEIVFPDEETGSLGEDEHPNSQDDGP